MSAPYLCHDFKSPRNDSSKRLPDSFKAVPVLFYLALLAGTYFMTMDWMAYKRAQATKVEADGMRKEYESAAAAMQEQKAALDAETAKAEGLAKWMEGARNLQPLAVAIARSMPPEVSLSELVLERSDQVPSNLSFSVNINGGTPNEVAMLETSLSRLQYRSYSPEQTKTGTVIKYRTTLVRQE
jgi:hypothetical protein